MPAWCGLALAGYAGKALFSTWSYQPVPHGHLSHAAACAAKSALQTEPGAMGTILDTPSGQYKTTIVDRVEGMEPTLLICCRR